MASGDLLMAGARRRDTIISFVKGDMAKCSFRRIPCRGPRYWVGIRILGKVTRARIG